MSYVARSAGNSDDEDGDEIDTLDSPPVAARGHARGRAYGYPILLDDETTMKRMKTMKKTRMAAMMDGAHAGFRSSELTRIEARKKDHQARRRAAAAAVDRHRRAAAEAIRSPAPDVHCEGT
jgi:hypothetical protein